MTGDKLPSTHSRARAFMRCNEVFLKRRKKLKREARREIRRFQKELKGER